MATLYVGSSQDYQTIQDAVNAANDGDTIIVKGSEYALTNEKVSITKAVTVQAEGDVTVDQFGIGSGTAKPQDIVIDGFTIKPTVCEIAASRTCGIYQNGTNLNTLTVTNCNFDLTEPAAETTGYGIHLDLNFSGTEKVTVDGCTFTGDDAMVTSAMRASYQSSIEFTNNTVSNISGHAVQMSLTGPTWGYDGDAAVTFEGNTFTDIGGCAIYAADIANNNVFFNVTENDFTNINVNGGSTYWGAIRFGSGSVNGLTVKDNTIVNGNVGIYQGVALKDGAEGTIEISGNNFILSDRPGYSASALNVYDNTTGTVNAGDFSGNELVVVEGATNILVDAALTGNEGDVVSLNGKNYIIGVNAFANLTDAVNAASTSEETVITVATGTYADNITLDSRSMEQKGDIKFIAAEGADVTFSGLFTIGYYKKRVGSQKWNADIAFENITFDQAAAETHSIDIQQVNDFTMTNCTVVGDGEYGLLGTNVDNGATITDCNFVNAGIQSAGNFGTALLISGGVFENSRINMQSGNSVTIDGVTFNNTLTDADLDNSFYVIRSNSIPMTITNCIVNIDSEVTGVAEGQEEWALLWARNATTVPWNIADIEINLTDAAMAQTSLDVVKNGKTADQNTPDRITVTGLISSENDIAELLAKTDGYVNVIDNGTYSIYNNGELVASYSGTELFVDASFTADNVGEGKLLGFNAFTSFAEALKAVNETTGKIVINGEITESATTDSMPIVLSQDLTISGGNVIWNAGSSWVWFKKADGVESVNLKFEDFTLSGAASNTKVFYFGSGVTATIGADAALEFYNGAIQPGATVIVEDGGKLVSLKEALQVQASADGRGSLIVNGEDTVVYTKYVNIDGDATVTDSAFSAYDYLRVRSSGVFTADGSLVEIGADHTGTWQGNPAPNGVGRLEINDADAVFNLKNGSTLKVSGNVTNKGTLNIEDSTFVANGTLASDGAVAEAYNKGVLTNNGTINVAGKSTLNIRELAGNSLTFAEDAALVDSNINYTGSDSFRFDGVTFEGDNTINSGAYATSGMSFTIAEGASLKSTGGRWTLGGTGVWNINGTIENAKELTDEEKAELTASLDLNGLSLSTGGGEAVMNVTNAYFTYGSGAVTTKNTNSTGGKIVMNFTNSVVESAYKYSVNPTKAGYDAANAPEVVLNVTGSVFNIKNYFTNNNAKGTVNVDNSDLTATAFGNVGTFSAVNGSVVNFSLVNNALGDWAGKGSLNAGSMLIDDSTLNIVNKTASLEFYNVGEITLANGAVLTLDRLVNAEANDLTGAGNINTTFADMVGNITIDETSKINVSTLFTNNGTITIDVTDDWKGVATIIDAVDGTTDFGEIVLNEADAANGLATRINAATGELMIYSVDTDTIYVNSAWADGETAYAFGDEVAEGKFYGINAFTSLDEALKAGITYGGAAIELLDETLVTENLQKVVTKMHGASGMDFSITGISAGNEFIAIEMRDNDKINPDEDFTELATLVIKDAQLNSYKIAAYENSKITIENSTIDFHGDQSGPLYTKGNGEIYVKDSVIKNNTQLSAMGTVMEFDNSTLDSGSAAQISGGLTFKNGSTYTLSSAKIYGGTGVLTVEDSTMVRKAARSAADKANALVYYINGAANIPTALADYAYCVFVGGSQYSTTAHTGTGVMNVTNSTFDISAAYADENYADIEGYENSKGLVGVGVGSALTITNSTFNTDVLMNEGTITIDALSTLTATTLTNSGTITIDAAGYTGDEVKIIDLSQEGKLANVTLKNAKGYVLRYENDGDVILAKTPEYVYVSSDYNSSTEGYGYDKFNSWDSAYAFTSANAKKATIVFEKTTTISGNCFPKQADGVKAIIVKDGATVGNANSKWDAVFAMTIEGGGILQSARPASAVSYGNTHVKNAWVIGEADSEKRAEIRFINGKSGVAYKTMSIALLSGLNRSITANNALIEVGDLGLQSNASFTDTTLTIEGILAIKGTSLYKTTMTNTTATVKGHNLMNENTYYSTVGTILATLTMDNSSITVDDGADDTAAETVWLGYTTNTAQTLTLTNGSTVTIEKDALAKVANKVTVTDSAIYAGDVDASAVKAGNSSFYFNQLEKGKVYYAVLYDAEGNELETIVRTSTSGSTFYPKFSAQPVGDYKAVCYADEAKTQIHQEKTYSFTAVGSVDLVNSDFYAEKLLLAGGNVTMDINSTLGFSSVEGGYITVTNAADYVDNEGQSDGTYLIFDYTGDAEMTVDDYKALLNDQWHDNYLVFNNDLYLSDQELGTVYVNSEWAGMEAGETTDEGYLYGFNAASALEEVGSMIATDGSDTTVKFAGDLEAGSVVFNYGSGDITFTADEKVTIKQNSVADWDFAVGDVDSTITIGENVTFELSDNVSDFAVWYGANLTVDGTIKGGANWGALYALYGDHTISSTGTVATGRVALGFGTLTVDGDAESDRTDAHIDTNYLLIEEGTFTANNAIINAGTVNDNNNGTLRYGASKFNINDSELTANTVLLKHADTEFTVTGESKINIGTLTGAITLDNAALTDSAINKGNVNFKGDNTFAGDFNASYAFVGDWNNEEYDGSVDFGTESNVNVNGQMIIGYDTLVAGANNVVFGDVTGETVTDKVFKAADVSVRRDGTLTITNTTGENNISTMNVMGSVVIDNAKLSGEVQIGNNSDDIDAVMTVQNGAEVTLGGSSNSVVILGKSNGGILNVDDAEVVVKRAGAGAGYRVPADTFVIGYQGGKGELNVYNNGKFSTADYNGDKDGGMMNVELNTGSVINVTDGGSVEVSGNVNNSGKITVDGGSLSAAGMDVQAQLRITGLTKGEARTIKVSLIKEGETSGTIVELDVAANATEAVLYLTEYADGNYSATVIDGTSTFNTAVEVVNGVLTVADGTLDIAGTLALNMSKLNVSGESTLVISDFQGVLSVTDGTVFGADTAITVTSGSVVVDGTLTMKQGAITGADSFTADKLILTDVVLPTDAAITVYAGATDIDKLVINGSNVTDGRAVIDGVAYDVITDETGITMSESVTDYTAMTVKPTGVKQAKDSYTFTVSVDVTGGEGDYTYQIIDEFGNVLADGLEFTVSSTPESSILNIGVKVFDTYGETTAVITAPIFVPVRDYTAPVFNGITASTTEETKRSVILTADFSDNFDAAVADNLTITYSVDSGKSWKEYTDGAKITANDTVIFKATDAEGNSTTAEYVVDNIVTEADYDRNGLSDTLFVHDNKLTSAWFTHAEDTEITLTDLGTMDDNMELLGSGRIYGSANDGSDIFYTDGTTVKAWDVQDGAIAGTTDVWKIDANREILGLGDFNGDGVTDLLIKSQYGDVGAIYAGAESKTTWNYFSSLGSEWKLTGIGDFNGDGVDDVALFNTRDGNAGCWISQEDGSVLWTALDKIPGGEIIGAGDFNGDGVDDVLIRKGDWVGAWIVEDGRAKELLGLGNITATVEQIADFNGDGISDLRVRDDNMIGVITVDADGKTQWKEFVGVGDEWKSSNVGIIA